MRCLPYLTKESACLLKELRKQGYDIDGWRTTPMGAKVDRVSLAPQPTVRCRRRPDGRRPDVQDFGAKFEKEFKDKPDHNGISKATSAPC